MLMIKTTKRNTNIKLITISQAIKFQKWIESTNNEIQDFNATWDITEVSSDKKLI